MKPIERTAAIIEAVKTPVMVVTPDPNIGHPDAYTLPADQFHRLLALAADAAWAAAFIDRLWAEAVEASGFATRIRDETYPVPPDEVNHEAGEEPGPADPWSQAFHEGAAHVYAMLEQLMHTDPEHFAPTDTAFRVAEPGPPALQRARATVLEFDPEPGGTNR
jgi:hypothetical protein